MRSADTAYKKEPALVFRLCLNFQKIRIFPQLLRDMEADSVLFEVGLALVVIELEFVHEYILYLFYSFGKVVGLNCCGVRLLVAYPFIGASAPEGPLGPMTRPAPAPDSPEPFGNSPRILPASHTLPGPRCGSIH